MVPDVISSTTTRKGVWVSKSKPSKLHFPRQEWEQVPARVKSTNCLQVNPPKFHSKCKLSHTWGPSRSTSTLLWCSREVLLDLHLIPHLHPLALTALPCLQPSLGKFLLKYCSKDVEFHYCSLLRWRFVNFLNQSQVLKCKKKCKSKHTCFDGKSAVHKTCLGVEQL